MDYLGPQSVFNPRQVRLCSPILAAAVNTGLAVDAPAPGPVCKREQSTRERRDNVRLMWNSKLSARPAVHECPACHQPQTKIQRKIGETPLGAICFVCARPDCSLGLNLTKVDTWVAV